MSACGEVVVLGLTARFQIALLKRFLKNDHANIAVIFAIAMVPMLTFLGAAIDYTRASSARSAMQTTLDTVSLMIAKDLSSGAITSSQVSTKAQAYFAALYPFNGATNTSISATYTAASGSIPSSVSVSGSAQVTTSFLKVAGMGAMGINSAATATWGGTRMRVAIALDVTGSMNSDGKLDAMKTAAVDLVATLKGLGSTPDDMYISIVPFAQMVNVGISNKSANWLRWDQLGSCATGGFWFFSTPQPKYNTSAQCAANGGTWTAASTNARANWKGCVTDRDQPYDTTSAAPTSNATDFPAVFYVDNGLDICPDELLPLTSTYTASSTQLITDRINGLTAAGGTNQAIGIQMAWQTLQSSGPFAAPAKDSNVKYTDVLIILSDGLNTMDRWYGNGAEVSSQVDARQTLLCQNINNQSPTSTQEYRVYTIQVNTDGDAESAVLKGCASSNGGFFPTTTASGIAAAFKTIGTSLSKLRVSQ
jgi:Flp pilus assembly protein TadG